MTTSTKILIIAIALGLLSSLADAQTKSTKQQVAIVPINIWNEIYSAYIGGMQQLKQNVLHDAKLSADQKVKQQIFIDEYIEKQAKEIYLDSLVVKKP